jgi:hypothetical protein
VWGWRWGKEGRGVWGGAGGGGVCADVKAAMKRNPAAFMRNFIPKSYMGFVGWEFVVCSEAELGDGAPGS